MDCLNVFGHDTDIDHRTTRGQSTLSQQSEWDIFAFRPNENASGVVVQINGVRRDEAVHVGVVVATAIRTVQIIFKGSKVFRCVGSVEGQGITDSVGRPDATHQFLLVGAQTSGHTNVKQLIRDVCGFEVTRFRFGFQSVQESTSFSLGNRGGLTFTPVCCFAPRVGTTALSLVIVGAPAFGLTVVVVVVLVLSRHVV